tara:strand:- start:1599 stop:1841 length:243 start_codon:yes stop_codon:yes gene_type:complete
MSKFCLYFGVKRGSEELETIALEGRGSLGKLKAQLKEDMAKESIIKKYSFLVIASDYGLEKRFKLAEPKKIIKKKKKLED